MRIRPAEDTDVVEVARTWRAGWLDAHLGHVPDALVAARPEEYFAETAARLVGSTLVADDDGALLGVVLVEGDELFQLSVGGDARGRGVGRALVTAAEQLIATEHDHAWLAVVPGNATARRLYERCGWVDEGEVIHQAPPREPGGAPIPVRVHHYGKQLR